VVAYDAIEDINTIYRAVYVPRAISPPSWTKVGHENDAEDGQNVDETAAKRYRPFVV
jgi:hypothetical protein